MQAKEQASLLRQKITRREFISSLALLGLLGATVEGTKLSTGNAIEIVSLSEFMKGFDLIDQDEFNKLIASVESKELPIADDGSCIVEDDMENILFKVSGTPDPSISLSVFEVHIDEKKPLLPFIQSEDRYIAPLIESEELSSTMINLGKLEPGNYDFSLQPTKYTKDIPSRVTTEAYTLSSQNPVMQTILNLVPKLSPRDDVYKYKHIPNDIPLYTYAKIRKNKENDYLVAYSFIASSEDGGSSPNRLLRGEGRTDDVEWILMQKISSDGNRLGRVFQTSHHQAAIMSSNLPAEFHVSTGNNMVDRDLAGDKIVSLFPEFLSGSLGGNDIIKRDNAFQVLSYRELLYERRMKLGDFSIQQFIQNHLGGINLLTFDLPWPYTRD